MIRGLYDFATGWSKTGSVWLYSDPHFDDPDCKMMDENWLDPVTQINNLKKTCHKLDTLICLGDFGNPEYFSELKCYKVGLLGNHDLGVSNYEQYFDELYNGPLFISNKILLSHEPIDLPFCLNIHGHDHSNSCRSAHHLNVAANVIGYKPISLKEIINSGVLKGINDIHRTAIDRQKDLAEIKKIQREIKQ